MKRKQRHFRYNSKWFWYRIYTII